MNMSPILKLWCTEKEAEGEKWSQCEEILAGEDLQKLSNCTSRRNVSRVVSVTMTLDGNVNMFHHGIVGLFRRRFQLDNEVTMLRLRLLLVVVILLDYRNIFVHVV